MSLAQTIFKTFGFGQHILNGATVGLGVAGVTAAMSWAFGFQDGMAAGVGALAGLLVGYGRWALPLSVLTLLAVVFSLGVALPNGHQAMRHEALFAAGGFCYMLVAFVATIATARSGQRIAVAECLREFAHYLRSMADFYDSSALLATVYARVVEQQAALADHLQAARQQVFLGQGSLAAAIVLQLDALDNLISTHADYVPLRRGDAGPLFPALVAAAARGLAEDLDGLVGDLLRNSKDLTLPNRQPDLDRLSEEAARLSRDGQLTPRSLRAVRATRTKFAWVANHLSRLPKVLKNEGEEADRLLRFIDLHDFLHPLSFAPALLRPHLTLGSPVMRHAIRLSAAMGSGYLLIALVPQLTHGNWILLTIAVILRAQYGVTKQRRNDRLLGNLVGCLLAAPIVGIRMLLDHRSAEINDHFANGLLERTRRIVLGQLDLSRDNTGGALLDDEEESTIDAEKALKIRCAELCAAAALVHESAARYQR